MPSIAELRRAGLTFDTDEAVAIVQQLITTLRSRGAADAVQPPYGPPSADTVGLNPDGSVSCRGCGTTPTLSEVGILLHSLLPAGSPSVPGSLRYTIACALLTVDMPPFDSLSDFSRDLGRHELGDRAEIVRGVLARADLQPTVEPFLRTLPSGMARPSATVTWRVGALAAAAAGIAAGLALLVAGERLRGEPTPLVAMRTVPPVAEIPIGHAPRTAARVAAHPRVRRAATANAPALGRGIIVVHDTPSRSDRTALSKSRTGVLDRLRLGWLRRVANHDAAGQFRPGLSEHSRIPPRSHAHFRADTWPAFGSVSEA